MALDLCTGASLDFFSIQCYEQLLNLVQKFINPCKVNEALVNSLVKVKGVSQSTKDTGGWGSVADDVRQKRDQRQPLGSILTYTSPS